MPDPGRTRRHRTIALGALASLAAAACGGSTFAVGASDAGEGADATVDAATPPFCTQGTYDFCADFDEGSITDQWDVVTKTGSSQLDVVQDDSTSKPSSVRMQTPQLPGAQGDAGAPSQSAVLVKRNLPKNPIAHLAFDLQIDETSFPNANDPNASVVLTALTAGKDYALLLALRPGQASAPFGLWLIEISSAAIGAHIGATPIAALPQPSKWAHVKLDLDVAATGSNLVVTLDQAPPQSITLSPPATVAGGDRTLTIGSAATGPCGEAKVRFDSVTWTH